MTTRDYTLKALTDIWTGDVKRQGDRLIPAGLLGSIRWWFEVLVRGLGGKACDPTVDGVRCPDANKGPHEAGHHCVVCELFGCTGWARKFRLMVLDDQGNILQGQINANQTFTLRFIPLRPIVDEEWCLLDATLRLIADYGAIGGRTVLKPSEEWGIADLGEADLENEPSGGVKVNRSRERLPLRPGDIIQEVNCKKVSNIDQLKEICAPLPHGTPITVMVRTGGPSRQIDVWAGKRRHQDFGLIEVQPTPDRTECKRQDLEQYVRATRWRQASDADYSWASLANFWCVKGRYLARQDRDTSSFNFVIGRPEPKNQSSQGDSWLAGRRPDRQRAIEPESKKVFSFEEPAKARRVFGFVQNEEEFAQILDKLEILRGGNGGGRQPDPVWQSFNPKREFLKGERMLEELFR